VRAPESGVRLARCRRPTAKRPHLDRALTSEESWESPESTALTPCSIRPPAHAATQRVRNRQSAQDCHSRRLTSAWNREPRPPIYTGFRTLPPRVSSRAFQMTTRLRRNDIFTESLQRSQGVRVARPLVPRTASSRPAMARLLRAIWATVAPGRRPAWPRRPLPGRRLGGRRPGRVGTGPCAGRCAAR
jgi:hypothetical protein